MQDVHAKLQRSATLVAALYLLAKLRRLLAECIGVKRSPSST